MKNQDIKKLVETWFNPIERAKMSKGSKLLFEWLARMPLDHDLVKDFPKIVEEFKKEFKKFKKLTKKEKEEKHCSEVLGKMPEFVRITIEKYLDNGKCLNCKKEFIGIEIKDLEWIWNLKAKQKVAISFNCPYCDDQIKCILNIEPKIKIKSK